VIFWKINFLFIFLYCSILKSQLCFCCCSNKQQQNKKGAQKKKTKLEEMNNGIGVTIFCFGVNDIFCTTSENNFGKKIQLREIGKNISLVLLSKGFVLSLKPSKRFCFYE